MSSFQIKCLYSLKFLIISLAITTVTGCIAVPLPGNPQEPLYSKQTLQSIKAGLSTQEDVRETLGDPDLIRLDSKLWIYGWTEYHGRIGALVFLPYAPVPVYDTLYDTHHTLFYEFDSNGVLQKSEYIEDKVPCRHDGICVKYWDTRNNSEELELYPWQFDKDKRERLFENFSLVYASDELNRLTKSLEPTSGQCGMYLFIEWPNDYFAFSIDKASDKRMDSQTYAFIQLEPGIHTLMISSGMSRIDNNEWRHDESYTFSCPSGELNYLKVKMEGVWTQTIVFETIESPSDRIKALEGKKLLLML